MGGEKKPAGPVGMSTRKLCDRGSGVARNNYIRVPASPYCLIHGVFVAAFIPRIERNPCRNSSTETSSSFIRSRSPAAVLGPA
jgi:hypothetical protein